MDQHELFMSCRRGDLSKLTYLVEKKEVDLNVRDKWDSTPLYYACLCGYTEVVKYLLDNGAKCEANTFDGERCLYAALTNKIKKLLRSYNMVSSRTMRRDLFDEFLRRLLEDASHADVVFHINHHSFPAHRSVLCARSQYFSDMFETRWHNRREIRLADKRILPSAFLSILQYLYTGRLEVSIKDIEHCQLLVKQCHLQELSELIEKEIKKIASFESSKLGVEVTMLSSAPSTERVQEELGKLADMALPSELSNLAFEPEFIPLYADICFDVDGHKFSCHKAFFCGRSDYFKVVLLDHFGEFECTDSLPIFTLRGVSIDVFVSVLYYIYQNSCRVDKTNVYEVLSTADMYLLPGLKRMCAGVIGEFMETENVISMLKTARIYNLPRLQNQCYQYMADNLEQMVTCEEFSDLVQEDANDVKMREETDTIDVIDEIRFHLTNFVQSFSDVQEANEKLSLIDNLLESLDLEG